MKHEKTEIQLNMESHVSVAALIALLRGDFADAIRECYVGISDASISERLRDTLVLLKGCAHAMQSDLENAEEDFSTWIRHNESDSSLGYNFRADIYERVGEWENALADLNQAILRTASDSPEAAAFLFRRATVWAELGERDASIRDYQTVVDVNPEHPTAVIHLILLKQGSAAALETAALLREKERDISIRVSEPEPTLDTALDRLVASDLEGALEICEWLSENRPDEINTVFVRGLAKDFRGRRFSEAGNTAEAENDYQAAIHDYSNLLDNHSEDSHFTTLAADRRGQLRLAIGSQAAIAGAIEDFSHVITQDPANPLVYLHRGQSYLARYDFEEANQDFNRVFNCNPDNTLMSLAYELNGTIALLNARHADAVQLFKKARNYAEGSPTEMHPMLFQAAGEYLQAHYETASALLIEIESRVSTLQGRARYEFERKLRLLQTELRPKIEAPEVPEDRGKAKCDAILNWLYEFFSPNEPMAGFA